MCWVVMSVKDEWGEGRIRPRKTSDPDASRTPVKGKKEESGIR